MSHEDGASGDTTVPRRTVLKTAAVGGLGLIVGDTLLGGGPAGNAASGDALIGSQAMQVETVEANAAWFSQRVWAISGNKVVVGEGKAIPRTTLARKIYRPKSAKEIASVLKAMPASTPVACVSRYS